MKLFPVQGRHPQPKRECRSRHRHTRRKAWLLGLGLVLAISSLQVKAWSEITLYPDRDNTLYETEMDAPGNPLEMSNGAGIFLFAGRTNVDSGFRLRRGLLHFDLSVLPPGSEVLSAELVLTQSHISPNAYPVIVSLHRAGEDWGEGTSDGIGPEGQGALAQPGDATWFHRFYNTDTWTSEGGVFAAMASASTTVGLALEPYTWSCTPDLVSDLQAWLDNSAVNFGWVVLGDENGGGTARRFNSRHHAEEDSRPQLHVVFRSPDDVFVDGFEDAAYCSE